MTRVAGIVVTYNRSVVLAKTLRAVQAQTRSADRIYVVDNASDDDTADLLRGDFPAVIHVRNVENLGCSGGLNRGVAVAHSEGLDAYWLMDDDSPPQPDALETLLTAARPNRGSTGIVGCRGGVVRHGYIRHIEVPSPLVHRAFDKDLFAVDFVLLDGSLVSRRTVDAIGLPRADYFTMLEDVEFSLRARRAGLDVLLLGHDLMQRGHLGSAGGSTSWRGYYQARNHLRMALDFRSPSLVCGYIAREARFIASALRARDRRWEHIKLRWRGLRDALLGRMGRRVEPQSGWS